MRIVSIGGGPAGLYFAILMKRLDPRHEVDVYERNRADDAFGWGVVFSAETLGNLEAADPESFAAITRHFAYWDDIHILYRDSCVRSTGHGFCGLSRKDLLHLLQVRCSELGVRLHFETEVAGPEDFPDADLILAADGINSRVRDQFADVFEPALDWRKNKFCWLGTPLPLTAFTFAFRDSPHGLFQVHAYPFQPGLATFIVECREEVWRRAGLDRAEEADTVAFCQELFADLLAGHPLLTNKSTWRTFPTVRCARWHHGNVVLVGDAAHTAHFSIGSGTKLAMEDAIALADAFARQGTGDVPAVLAAYDTERRPDVGRTQSAAQTSLEWFENVARYQTQAPTQFAFNLLTRSKRITFDNLQLRDPEFVAAVRDWYGADQGGVPSGDGHYPPPMFTPFELRGLRLVNRIVVSPMCQYCAVDGLPDDWHLVHLGSRAVGGAGLVFTEMTDVSAEARISIGCTGMYLPQHQAAWQRIVEFVHGNSPAKIGLQLGHAGRKGATTVPWEGEEPMAEGAWPLLAPSALPYRPHDQVPRAMDRADMDQVVADYVRATTMGAAAGFDLVELHMAHGYLFSSFISPLSNRRTDGYGGRLSHRMRFPLEVLAAVRAVWPADRPISVRISATDWTPDGLTGEDAVQAALMLAAEGCDIVDVSAGQTSTAARPLYGRMFQVPFADHIRHAARLPVIAVGNIQGADHANTVLAAGRADLVALARPHLRNPYLTLHAAETYGHDEQPWPKQYLLAKPRPRA
jgi:anthraniloyl-CoA monooxygenase